MIKAQDLIKKQKKKESRKYLIYDKIYKSIEKKIELASSGDHFHTWYEIPVFILGCPVYSVKDCKEYIGTKLKNNGFECNYYDSNLLLIKWLPS
jgi:hypothetical protein